MQIIMVKKERISNTEDFLFSRNRYKTKNIKIQLNDKLKRKPLYLRDIKRIPQNKKLSVIVKYIPNKAFNNKKRLAKKERYNMRLECLIKVFIIQLPNNLY